MSTFVIVCVRDHVAGVYHQPMFFPNEAAAVRAFSNEVTRPADDNLLYHNFADFDLYRIGEYDGVAGSLSAATAEVLCHGRDVPRPA